MGDTERYQKTVQGTFDRLSPPKKLLLLDDDPNDLKSILQVLKEFNVEVTVFHSGEEAIKHAKLKKFDFLMFDLVMPGFDGMDFMVGAVRFQPGASFLLVTGYPLSPKTEAVRKLGAVQLCKPVTPEILADILPRKPLTSRKKNGRK